MKNINLNRDKTYHSLVSRVLSKEDSILISPKDTARLLSCGQSTLARHRSQGTGIPYVKLGRSVRYSLTDIFSWMEKHKVEVNNE